MNTNISSTNISMQAVNSLQPYPNNPRKHPKAQIKRLSDSIKTFGFTNPVLVNKDNQIIAGHGRFEAAKLLGIEQVPVIRLEHLTVDEVKAYIIADNRLAEKSSWDKDLLAIEMKSLIEINPEFELSITGFDNAEIDFMILDHENKDPDEGDTIPEPPLEHTAKLGDLWQLGEHLIFCGDSTKPESYIYLLGDTKAQAVVTDPPYNVPIQGHASGLGKVKHEEFAMASGEMTPSQFTAFLDNIFKLLVTHSTEGSLHYIFMSWHHAFELQAAASSNYSSQKNLCVWSKDKAGMGSLYRSQHELVFVYKNGLAPHINNVELGKNGRNRSNIWHYRSANSTRRGGKSDLDMHPTVKPSRMLADAILDSTYRDGLVLDPFGGSGSTLIGAEKTGRKARLIELEPKYVDVSIKRWEQLTGKKAKFIRNVLIAAVTEETPHHE